MNAKDRQAAVDAVLTGWTEGAADPAPAPAPLPAGALDGYCVRCGERHCFCARRERAKDCPHGQTWVKRKLGPAYDPDTTCPYTGFRLWPFAAVDCRPWRIEYWREDGHLFRVRRMTEAEGMYTMANFATVAAKRAQLQGWLASLGK